MADDSIADKLIDACRVLVDDGQGGVIWGYVSPEPCTGRRRC